jgi:predicted secreted protein
VEKVQQQIIQELAMELPAKIDLKVGETYTLKLPGLGTAGYQWTYDIGGDRNLIDVSQTTAKSSEFPAVGSSMDRVFILGGLAMGQVTIHFMQRRPWEKNQPPVAEHTLEVDIKA